MVSPHHYPRELSGLDKRDWLRKQGADRSIIERLFGRVKKWKAARLQSRHTPEMQAMMLVVIYWIVNFDIDNRPLCYKDWLRWNKYK